MDIQNFIRRAAPAATESLVSEVLPGRLGQFVANGAESAVSEMLNVPPKRVALPPMPDLPVYETDEEAENPFDRVLDSLQQEVAPPPQADAEPLFVPLTEAEIRSKAESKAEMWAAIMALLFSIGSRLVAYQKLTETDRKWIRKHERYVELHGESPDYDDNHPYWDARDHYKAYETALDEGSETAPLDPAQKDLLQRAIEADLRAKNKREALQQTGIAMTLAEIMMTKMTEPIMGMGLAFVNKLTDKSIRKR